MRWVLPKYTEHCRLRLERGKRALEKSIAVALDLCSRQAELLLSSPKIMHGIK